MRRYVGVWLLAALVMPSVLAGQGVRGSVVDGAGRPIANALIDVSTPAGEVVGRATTNQGGTYLVRLATAGAYEIRVRAIGYAQVRLTDLRVHAEVVELPVVRMSEAVAVLPEVVARATGGRCRSTPETGRVLAPLLEAAANALEVMEQTIELGSTRHVVEIVHRTALATRRDSIVEADTTRLGGLSWPVVSPGAEELKTNGFARAPEGRRGGRWIFYGPDAAVLFSDWFIAGHCFDLIAPDPGSGTIVVRFEPTGRSDKVRVAGRLVLDQTSLALRELHFEHRNVLGYLPDGSVGGAVHFALGADGAWRPKRWRMWAPAGLPARVGQVVRLQRNLGTVEVSGRVVEENHNTRDASDDSPRPATGHRRPHPVGVAVRTRQRGNSWSARDGIAWTDATSRLQDTYA